MPRAPRRRPALLVLLEGMGVAPAGPANAVSLAHLPYLGSLELIYPHAGLLAGEGSRGRDLELAGLATVNEGRAFSSLQKGAQGRAAEGALSSSRGSLLGAVLSRGLSAAVFCEEEPAVLARVREAFPETSQASSDKPCELVAVGREAASTARVGDERSVALTKAVAQSLRRRAFDVTVVVYSDADLAAATGDAGLCAAACEAVDDGISRIVPEVLARGGFALVAETCGNVERLFTTNGAGERVANVGATQSDLRLFVADPDAALADDGSASLEDVAPTFLSLMGLPVPDAMTGRALAVR